MPSNARIPCETNVQPACVHLSCAPFPELLRMEDRKKRRKRPQRIYQARMTPRREKALADFEAEMATKYPSIGSKLGDRVAKKVIPFFALPTKQFAKFIYTDKCANES